MVKSRGMIGESQIRICSLSPPAAQAVNSWRSASTERSKCNEK